MKFFIPCQTKQNNFSTKCVCVLKKRVRWGVKSEIHLEKKEKNKTLWVSLNGKGKDFLYKILGFE